MLADRPIHTALPATDLERARRFYAEKLGLTPESELPDVRDGLFYRCGGVTRFLLFPSPNSASGTHTQMTWTTHDIEADVAELNARGVVFEEYDTPEVKTVKSVATIGQSNGVSRRSSSHSNTTRNSSGSTRSDRLLSRTCSSSALSPPLGSSSSCSQPSRVGAWRRWPSSPCHRLLWAESWQRSRLAG